MNAAELFVRCLQNEGVQYIFGVPGEENEALLMAIAAAEGITFIPCRHEQGAAFIANVWGRLTGKAGVCLSTLGPGATNLLTGVADANLDKAPLVAITGQGSLNRLHHESHQLIDVVQLFRPVTKWNAQIESPEIIGEVTRKAFKLAQLEKPGATHLELPENIAGQKINKKQQPVYKQKYRRASPDKLSLTRAIKVIQKAKKVIVLAGNGAIRKRASKELTVFTKRHNFPVAATFMGKGAVSDQLPQSLLAVGLGFKDYVIEAFEQADVVLAIGYDIAEFDPIKFNPKKDKKIIHIDFEYAEVYENYVPEIEIVGDVAETIRLLDKGLIQKEYPKNKNWFRKIRKRILADIDSYTLKEGDDFTVPGVLNSIRKVLAKDGIVISDVGAHKMWIARNFPTYVPNGCIISNGMASMGISLPGGIAASMAQPMRQVVCLMGDGGFMMNLQEIETAKRLGLGYTIIIFNNNDFGLISWKQERNVGKSVFTQLTNPNFKKLAESFGIKGYRAHTVADLDMLLHKVIINQELSIIEVPTNPKVNSQLIEKLETYFSKKK